MTVWAANDRGTATSATRRRSSGHQRLEDRDVPQQLDALLQCRHRGPQRIASPSVEGRLPPSAAHGAPAQQADRSRDRQQQRHRQRDDADPGADGEDAAGVVQRVARRPRAVRRRRDAPRRAPTTPTDTVASVARPRVARASRSASGEPRAVVAQAGADRGRPRCSPLARASARSRPRRSARASWRRAAAAFTVLVMSWVDCCRLWTCPRRLRAASASSSRRLGIRRTKSARPPSPTATSELCT